MIDGPLDGQILNLGEGAPAILRDHSIPDGIYVQTKVSEAISAYRWIIARSRWEKRPKRVAWTKAKGVSFRPS